MDNQNQETKAQKLDRELKELRLKRQTVRLEIDRVKLQKLEGTYKAPKASVKNTIIAYILISFLFVPMLLLGLMFLIGM
ncbi:hypothetical protein LW4_038 [Lactococcus phage LW4]|uniref:Uncharacterized protein n=4 Tax=Teubervirus LW31 TaxID=2845420 RepID=A0A1W6JHW0_9CAUD|nr:hypothetical protein H1N70_gp37 [Lactococcus phage LW31]ARM65639.1 hypothetical protein LW31_037 [Lactococcus phage LW31]ARM65727.1 hypothetical protein LW32_040 [Lactococcus phage LW32]ARM65812.1 hypothetical protein LW33_038 [Lactococcus phage LW33]ARM65898.1 hypothetical protein LW4_038 [Lactococcus phage LW4]